jgi:hypothetical protein
LLLPELKEMSPGNPIPNYLRILLDQDPANERTTIGGAALRQADRAARMDKPDWQILLKARTDGVNLLLPDVQKIRELAAGLQARFQDEIAQSRFDDAISTAKTMFAISRHMGEHPTLIGDLVGIAIANITINPLDEMLEQPGCPNLYWALTNLPSPLVPLDKGMEGERLLITGEFRDLDQTAPMSEEQIKKLIEHIDKLRQQGEKPLKPEESVRTWLDGRLKDPEQVNAARLRLQEAGFSEERLRQFPPGQVLFLDNWREYELRRDEVMKLMNLPTWQAEALASQAKPLPEPAPFAILVPALQKVRRAQGRLEQRIVLLRHVEALRLYAAEHEGRLPSTLDEVTVPLPVDPFSGKSVRYEVDGSTAHLRGCPPPGAEKEPAYNVHYVITIRK